MASWRRRVHHRHRGPGQHRRRLRRGAGQHAVHRHRRASALLVFFGSTILHAVIFMGLYELLGRARIRLPVGGVLGQAAANALVGVVDLAGDRAASGAAVERRQAQRGSGFRVDRRLDWRRPWHMSQTVGRARRSPCHGRHHRAAAWPWSRGFLRPAPARSGSSRSSSTRSSARWPRTTISASSPLRAPRGVLFDRNGRVLVENRPAFNVSIVRLKTTDLDRTIRLLSAVAGVDERNVREIVDRHRREPSYRPIVVIENATLAQVAAITARRLDFELPDVVVQQVPTRAVSDERARRAPVRLRRRGQRRAGRRPTTRSRAATSSARPGSRRRTTRC